MTTLREVLKMTYNMPSALFLRRSQTIIHQIYLSHYVVTQLGDDDVAERRESEEEKVYH